MSLIFHHSVEEIFPKAISYKNSVEAISLVLYPEDSFYEGKMLRLKQQYFFVSAGIQSIVRHYKKHKGDIKLLDEKIAIASMIRIQH